MNVYAFDGEIYTGYRAVTDAGGQVVFILPEGNYHFRADYDGVYFWSGTENTCTIPGCEEDAVTLPGGTGEQEVRIDYTYDALNRLISAEYSNGTAFGYTYDAAGNVLTYAETHYGQTTVTTYTYDAANQLLNAIEEDTTWYNTYDGNGSLIQTDPGTEVGNGSTRDTYNTAGYLTKVENFTTEWQTQSEMTYDGLGNRLEVITYSDGEGNTTRYVLDGGAELTAIGTDNTTYYLYGLGAIGTLGESWSYMLQDGAGSTRQLVDEEGAVTLSISYTPWGDTLEIYGSGNLDFSYLGGIYDAGTGLIYMGNGQYYDPYTNRFLNRGDDGQSDPYAPWSNNVASMLISPLTLLALLFGRKKNRTKFDNAIIVLVLVLTLSTSMFVVGESFVPSVSADVDRLPISWPPHAEKIDKYVTLPADIQTSAYTPVMKILLRYCNMPKSDIANYDPTIEPKGYISWGPTVYLDSDLIQFNGTQDFVDTDMNGVFDIYDQGRSYTHWGPNLCGQAAIAIIIQSTLGEVYPLTEIVEGVDTYLGKWSEGRHNQDTTSADTLAMALTIAREENNYQIDYRFYLGEEVKSYRHSDYYNWTYGKRIYPNQPEALYATSDPASMEYAEFIRSQISQNHYHIALVTINKDNHGYLSKYTSPDTDSRISHWVVVSGFGEQWDRQGPDFEWVRIYNPYHDQTEYYPLADFLASVHPYSSLEIWQMGASPYMEDDPISNY